MSGVYDKTTKYCEVCKTDTEHETGWESEEPNVLDYWCKVCKKHTRVKT